MHDNGSLIGGNIESKPNNIAMETGFMIRVEK